jgi:lethal(2) giant larvae protein
VEFSGRTNTEKSITKIFSFGKLHQYITVQDDNSLLLWQLEGEESLPSLKIANEYHLEQEGDNFITSCCLSQLAGHFYIGTEGGNIYTLDVRLFILKSEDSVINWTNATALIQSANKIHPGAVCSIELCPTNFNKLLIGYEKGIIVLWDITQPVPERNFPSSIENCKQPLKCVSWQKDGQKFVSAHSDSSIYFWDSSVTVPEEGPTKHYGKLNASK